MNALQFNSAAEDFIKTIKPLLGEYDITFMDTAGAILASSFRERVGLFHHGAAEAARTGVPVRIHSGNIAAYPGSYEGVCFPIVKDGALLGVLGIRGAPDEVESMAGLLAACVELYLGRNAHDAEAYLRRDMRLSLLESIAGDTPPAPEAIGERCRELRIAFRLPVRIVAVVAPADQHGGSSPLSPVELEKALTAGGWLNQNHDLAGVLGGGVLIAKHVPDDAPIDMFARKLRDGLRHGGVGEIGVGIGSFCEKWEQLSCSRREAKVLADLGDGVRSIDAPSGRMACMLWDSLHFGAVERHLAELERALRRGIGGKDYRQVMRTMRAYCDADCHSGKAAENLGIHKNTMNYRMNKIITLLGLEKENTFVREFFLKLMVLRYFSPKQRTATA